MIEFLHRLFIGHVHKWKVRDEIGISREDGRRSGYKYIQECEHCGKLRQFNV